MLPTSSTPILLFVHGSNFCKEVWRPIQRHLQGLPLLQRLADNHLVSMDLPYHGSKRDDHVHAVVDEVSATVDHPAARFVTMSTEAVKREVQRLQAKFGKHPIVAIGHSVGASALWNVEVQSPGTFEGLVLFEPIVEKPGTRVLKTQRYIFNLALKRQGRWATRDAAVSFFENARAIATWDRECLARWLEAAIVPEEKGSEAVVLACHPTIEAAIYCGERLWLSVSELANVACPVTFHSSDDTWLFDHDFFASVEQRWPRIYTNHVAMKSTTHNLVMEKPKACANAIHADLKQLDCFKSAFARL